MYPDPTEALVLPAHASLDHYRKLAKDFVKSCAADSDAVRAWASRFPHYAGELAQFAQKTMHAGKERRGKYTLADAQFVIARAHGFLSWPKFVDHVRALRREDSPTFAFESAVDAVVRGDAAGLEQRLRERPNLARATSSREHGATLLHYTAANGVEGERQISPPNAPAIAEMLLRAGAEVDAEASVYGGGCTTLGLVATSMPPFLAGVQRPLMDVLLEHGARLDRPDSAGNRHGLVLGCLANGQPEAAQYLASRGAPLDLTGAAGLGQLDLVQSFVDADGRFSRVTAAERDRAFAYACVYGRAAVVDWMLQYGVDVDARLSVHGRGHTGLHVAAYHAHVDTVRVLLRHGAAVSVIDESWRTPPLVWALQAWSNETESTAAGYAEVVSMLVGAGAEVKPAWLEWDKVRATPAMRDALQPARR